jgi:hypothetical protein
MPIPKSKDRRYERPASPLKLHDCHTVYTFPPHLIASTGKNFRNFLLRRKHKQNGMTIAQQLHRANLSLEGTGADEKL